MVTCTSPSGFSLNRNPMADFQLLSRISFFSRSRKMTDTFLFSNPRTADSDWIDFPGSQVHSFSPSAGLTVNNNILEAGVEGELGTTELGTVGVCTGVCALAAPIAAAIEIVARTRILMNGLLLGY